MRLVAIAAAAVFAAACATVPADAAQPAGTPSAGRPGIAPGDENCDVTIVFGSYAMGIDGVSHDKIEAYLKRRAPAVTYTASRWGREGEQTFCVTTRSNKATRKVFNDVRNMAPRVARRGPIEIRSRFGSFQSRPPASMGQ